MQVKKSLAAAKKHILKEKVYSSEVVEQLGNLIREKEARIEELHLENLRLSDTLASLSKTIEDQQRIISSLHKQISKAPADLKEENAKLISSNEDGPISEYCNGEEVILDLVVDVEYPRDYKKSSETSNSGACLHDTSKPEKFESITAKQCDKSEKDFNSTAAFEDHFVVWLKQDGSVGNRVNALREIDYDALAEDSLENSYCDTLNILPQDEQDVPNSTLLSKQENEGVLDEASYYDHNKEHDIDIDEKSFPQKVDFSSNSECQDEVQDIFDELLMQEHINNKRDEEKITDSLTTEDRKPITRKEGSCKKDKKQNSCGSKTRERKLRCPVCQVLFSSKALRFEHMNKSGHNFRFPCDSCEMQFKQKVELQRHTEQRHSEERTYSCSKCPRKFKSEYSMKRHEANDEYHQKLSKSDSRPFLVCQYCDKHFPRKRTWWLRHHIKRYHMGIKSAPCGTCGKTFNSDSYVEEHRLACKGVKQYVCEYCLKRFSKKSTLANHVRQHTGEKPYNCSLCSTQFRSYDMLMKHAKKEHNVKNAAHYKQLCSSTAPKNGGSGI